MSQVFDRLVARWFSASGLQMSLSILFLLYFLFRVDFWIFMMFLSLFSLLSLIFYRPRTCASVPLSRIFMDFHHLHCLCAWTSQRISSDFETT